MSPQDQKIRSEALHEVDLRTSAITGMPVREISERREKIQKMYDMLHSISEHYDSRGLILGEGFFIKHEPEYYQVYRKGFDNNEPQRVKDITRVMTLFTPEMFVDGIPTNQ